MIRPIRSFVVLACAMLAFALSSCVAGSGPDPSGTGQTSQALTASTPVSYPLAMGNTNQQVGTVTVWNDETTLYVEFTTLAGYELSEAHLCASLTAFAWTPPGQCAYNAGTLPDGTTLWLFSVPLADLGAVDCGSIIYLQAHASIEALNSATHLGSAYAGTFKGRVAYDITCDVPPPDGGGCTLTQGYWKTHPSAWPVSGLTIGGVSYTRSQLISFLKTPPRGDASIILGHQLVATLLNLEAGAYVAPEIVDAVNDAQAWMAANKDADGRLPYGIRATSEGLPNPAAFDEGINLSAVLDLYNNGNAGTPHCE